MMITILLLLIPSDITFEKQFTIGDYIQYQESKYSLPKNLLSALIYVESKNNHKAFVKSDGKSKLSSYGLMQVQVGAARSVGFKGKPKELLNPYTNIEYGAKYLNWNLVKQKGNVSQSLICYNAGPYSESCKYKKSSEYVSNILNTWVSLNAK